MDFFYGLGMTQGYHLDHSLSQRLFKKNFLTHWTLGLIHVLSLATQTLKTFFYNVLLELGGLPHVIPLAVHLPGMTLDTFLTLRNTKGIYLDHVGTLRPSKSCGVAGLPISILPLRAHFDPKVSAPGYLVSQEFVNMPTEFWEEKWAFLKAKVKKK